MIKNFIFFTFFVVVSYGAEKSVFGAGDLNSPTPYGLTPVEEVVVESKKLTVNNEKKIKKVDSQLTQVFDKVDGLESLFEGETKKLNQLSIEVKQQGTQLDVLQNGNKSNKEEIELLQKDVLASKKEIEINTKNIELLKQSFDKLLETVNKINREYVTKDEFNKLLSMLDKKETANTKSKKTTSSENSNIFSNKTNKELMEEARELFKKDYFTKAIPILEHLINQRHRPAECNYYLGEIHYYRKNYKEALHYFKTSMILYDKAAYLPKLLLHSAESFESLGDIENAKNFYTTIVDVYPKSPEAKEASKKIQ